MFFGFPRRAQSCRAGFMAFIKFFSAGYVLFCVPKENQKGRRCPQGMKAPVGLLSRRPVCVANTARSARQGLRYFRGAGGDGLRLPASASCLGRHSHPAGRGPNSSSLFLPQAAVVAVANYGLLAPSNPKAVGLHTKIQVAALKDFLCCADFKAPQPLRRQLPAGERGLNITFALSAARMLPQGASAGNTPLTATTPSREKANKPAPQGWLVCNI